MAAEMEALETLWAYLGQGRRMPAEKSVGVLCGSRDLFVADSAADLFHSGIVDPIICTGSLAHTGDLLATAWSRSEAAVFADALKANNVPAQNILIEDKATNTAENISFSLLALEARGLSTRSLCFIHKPFMVLRTYLTARKLLGREDFSVHAPTMALSDYLDRVDDVERTVNIMVGDFERIFAYGLKGFADPYPISSEAIAAARDLRRAGYDRHSIVR